ncbi:MAG: GIY-YIG nuclease family protein [bacterium]|nr:GIY-YIG nuclease family protein [bacterium]
MGILYILRSKKSGKYYIGSTNDLDRRIAEHNSGKTKSLRNLRPLEIVFKLEYPSLLMARRKERALKQLKSRSALEVIVKTQKLILGL